MEREAKIAAFKERDAARKREKRRLAKIEREKEASNLARQAAVAEQLRSGYDVEEARSIVKEILAAAEKDAAAMIRAAQDDARKAAKDIVSQLEAQAKAKARRLELEAKEKARRFEEEAESWANKTKEKCEAFVRRALEGVQSRLPSAVREERQGVVQFIEGCPDPSDTIDVEEAKLKRKREQDALRQRRCYEKKRRLQKEMNKTAGGEGLSSSASTAIISSSSARFVAKRVIDSFELYTRKRPFEFKRAVWEFIWSNIRVGRFLPSAFSNAKEARTMVHIVANMRRAIHDTKHAARKDHQAAKYTLLSGMVDRSTVEEGHCSAVAKIFRIKRQNLLAAADRRDVLDQDRSMSWPMGKRKTRSGRRLLSTEVKELAIQWWTTESRVLPGRKDVCRKRIGRKRWETHIIQILDETQVEFYRRFKERYPEAEIGQRAFEGLKPYFVRMLKDRFVCCCQYHVQMSYLKDAFNTMRVKLHRTEECTCECVGVCKVPRLGCANNPETVHLGQEDSTCKGHMEVVESVTELWEMCVCPKALGKAWPHRLECINGQCEACGISKLQFCDEEIDPESEREVAWQAFEYVVIYPNGRTPKGRKVSNNGKRIKLVFKKTHPSEFVSFVQKKLPAYIQHNFRAKWQTRAFQECLNTFPPGVVVSVIDFSENYSFQAQHEIQSMHWHNDQITLLIHITYRHDMTKPTRYDPLNGHPMREIIKTYHVYVSDDKEHDTLFVHHCLDKHAAFLEEQQVNYYEHWVWSDGAASQFKCARNFYYIARHHLSHSKGMRWYFFASGHGKGEHDGAGGVIKRVLRFEQLKQDSCYKLQNAADAKQFLSERFGGQKAGEPIRHFWLIVKEDVIRGTLWGCKTLKGSRSMHVFIGCNRQSSTVIKTRSLACMCTACLDGNDMTCESAEWCGPWTTQELSPSSIQGDILMWEQACAQALQYRAEQGDEADGEDESHQMTPEDKAALVQRGDNFAVVADQPNPEGALFYILKCDEPVRTLTAPANKEEFWTDQEFGVGEEVITGKYYQLVSRNNKHNYMLLDDRKSAMHLSATVRFVSFQMKPYKGGRGPNRRFKLADEDLQAIESALEDDEPYKENEGDSADDDSDRDNQAEG